MTYRMLVTDIDDTLVNDHNQISQANRMAIQEMIDQGYQFVLASGRPLASVLDLARDLNLFGRPAYIVAYNGGQIMNIMSQEIIFRQGLDLKDQEEIVPFIREQGLVNLTYLDDHIVIDGTNDYTHVEEAITGIPTRLDPQAIDNAGHSFPKIIGVGDPDRIKEILKESQGRFGQYSRGTTSKPYYLEIIHQNVSKGHAIQWLAKHLGLDMEAIIGMGDANNDIELIEMVGHGVAVANATQSLKDRVKEISPSNNDHGVAFIINKYFNKD